MTTTQSRSRTSLVEAIESRDADAIVAHYADDATLVLLDRDHPPSKPQLIIGRTEIDGYYRDVCGRNIMHEVRDVLTTADGLAYAQHCRYPDGAQVVCATVATLRDGLIVRQTAVQAWDET